ncbi:MAG: acyltransferase [Muribaculaceae bacterium]
MKKFIKLLLTLLHCLIFRVKYTKGLYIGYGAKLVGGKKHIILNEKAQVMPYSMIVSLDDGIIEVGEGTTISMFSRIASLGHVKFGKYVGMGPNCFIADFNHEYTDITMPIKQQGLRHAPTADKTPNVEIGDGSWIGTHVVIAGNIKIGKHSVIGANSMVTHDIPDYCVAVGAPARIIKRYNPKNNEWEKV